MSLKIGIDVGGTFTDFLLTGPDGEGRIFKVLSTPDDPSIAVLNGLSEMAQAEGLDLRGFLQGVGIIVHGTTVTTNAVLTGRTARTGLLTTHGFRDALQMRRGLRERLYDNKYEAPRPIVPRYLRLPVTERIDQAGAIVAPLDLGDIDAAVEIFRKEGVKAVAISFMHSYANPIHEEQAAERVRALLPDVYLSVSSRVLPQVRFYERTSTAVLNAAVGPILRNYLGNLTRRLEEAGFPGILLIMQSNGGVTAPKVIGETAASTLLSGPAAAPIAGLAYAALHGEDSFITVDMGGTSFDAALVKNGAPAVTTHGSVDRLAMALPMMEIVTIGAGGGSIAWIDSGGLLRMGPQSAGAKPGPVCYGLGGTEPACSDANLILGYLSADFFAGGRIKLDLEAARNAIAEKVGKKLGLDTTQAAAGMYRIMNVNMASAIREISIQKGYDPREFPLICAGGAGAIHAAQIAKELGIGRILVPREAPIFCAAGMLRSDLKHDYVRSYATPLAEGKIDPAQFAALIEAMRAEARTTLVSEGIGETQQRFVFALDLRYLGQYHEVSVEVPEAEIGALDLSAIAERFHQAHDRLYGYHLRDEGTQIDLVNIRLTGQGITDKPVLKRQDLAGSDPAHARKGARPIYLPERGGFAEVPVFDGDRLAHGNRLNGPAIVESVNTTIVVHEDFALEIDAYGTAVLTHIPAA